MVRKDSHIVLHAARPVGGGRKNGERGEDDGGDRMIRSGGIPSYFWGGPIGRGAGRRMERGEVL